MSLQANQIVRFIDPLPNDTENQLYFIFEVIGTGANMFPLYTGLLNPPTITAPLALLTDEINDNELEYVMGEFDQDGNQTGTPHVE